MNAPGQGSTRLPTTLYASKQQGCGCLLAGSLAGLCMSSAVRVGPGRLTGWLNNQPREHRGITSGRWHSIRPLHGTSRQRNDKPYNILQQGGRRSSPLPMRHRPHNALSVPLPSGQGLSEGSSPCALYKPPGAIDTAGLLSARGWHTPRWGNTRALRQAKGMM